MPHSPPSRLPVALGAAVVAMLVGAAPALSSEGPVAPPPLPTGAAPVVIPPLPIPAASGHKVSRPSIRRARLVPRRLRSGRRSRLRLTLSAPGRVIIVMKRMSRPGRGRVARLSVAATGRTLTIRLPRRAHGRNLAAGRYRISVVATDAAGGRSRTVRRTLVVLRAGH